MGIDATMTKPDEAVTSLSNKTTLDPAASSSSLRPIISTGQKEALKNTVYLDDSTDPLHTEHVDINVITNTVIAHTEPLIDPPMVEPHLHTFEGEVSSDTDSEGTESDFSHSKVESLGQINWKIQIGRKLQLKKIDLRSIKSTLFGLEASYGEDTYYVADDRIVSVSRLRKT
ncbi:hypothetical protein LWI28_025712 [Acer negundo]|uniref:Uncharacterized protein n=1 Tax=Acer negundo TaxID=4023 RepID=A0AAD5IH63_ACENE|nr:hypothetical protein LWI28_025712 [Acer negundo]